jgi:hypothetical protein
VNVGDAVLFRSIYNGEVRWCYPSRYVGEWNGRHGLYCGPGYAGKTMTRNAHGSYLVDWSTGVPPIDAPWDKGHVLRFMREGDAHTIEICWDHDWNLVCWYINLNSPIVIRGRNFDETDWALDVWVDPDGSWRWKDEDDFAEVQALGILDPAAAAALRAEGARVIAERPWPTGWEDWRPPPEWEPLPLPEDWHVV